MKKLEKISALEYGDLEYTEVDGHGGGCCGIQHIYNFPDLTDYVGDEHWEGGEVVGTYRQPTLKEKHDWLLSYMECSLTTAYTSIPAKGLAYEVVLIDSQLKQWKSALLSVGFRRVFSFWNKNSGNQCHVFYLDTAKIKPYQERKSAERRKACKKVTSCSSTEASASESTPIYHGQSDWALSSLTVKAG